MPVSQEHLPQRWGEDARHIQASSCAGHQVSLHNRGLPSAQVQSEQDLSLGGRALALRQESCMRRAARTDSNQQAIMDRLRSIGCRVYHIKEPVDLLVGYRQRTVCLEVKADGGRLTKQQIQFIAEWNGGPVHIVRDPEEAVNIVIEECR